MTAQPGIFSFGAPEHLYLQGDLRSAADLAQVRRLLLELLDTATVKGGVNVVIGVRPELWPGLATTRPLDAIGFNDDVVGPDGFRMPATQHDLWIWFSAASRSQVFDAATLARAALAELVDVTDESDGWVYRHNRDLTGFIDGTENPPVDEATRLLDQDGQGCIALIQLWLHDLNLLVAMTEADQEAMIGRTKPDSIELDEAVMPLTSHVARTAVTDEAGVELPILRHNTATGTPARHGTQFVGFSPDRARLQLMLDRMAGIPDGVRDELTKVTEAISGAYYYVPTVEELTTADAGAPESARA